MTIRRQIKHILRRFFPKQYHDLRWRYGHPARYSRVAQQVVKRHGRQVVAGPFVGMIYVDEAAGSAYIPKLLGSYEEELHDIFERLVSTSYEAIVDVGCAEGYYAVGMALRCPEAQVYAFDIDAAAQTLTAELAVINHVRHRVTVGGECSAAQLVTTATGRTLIISDCEGHELELFQPTVVTQLEHCDFLIELHDFLHSGITEILLGRFEDTHDIEIVAATERKTERYPMVAFLAHNDKVLALSESRPSGQRWMFLTSKSAHA